MKILIGCEESGVVRDAFSNLGHDAYSCDLLERDHERHLCADVVEAIKSQSWDMLILHPPCTALAVSGNRWYGTGMPRNNERLSSIDWTMDLWYLALESSQRVALENPVGVLPVKPSQYIQPWQFGHGETKKTGLWLHGLPLLEPTNVVEGREQRVWRMPPSSERQRLRSQTYIGIASAMAAQWGGL